MADGEFGFDASASAATTSTATTTALLQVGFPVEDTVVDQENSSAPASATDAGETIVSMQPEASYGFGEEATTSGGNNSNSSGTTVITNPTFNFGAPVEHTVVDLGGEGPLFIRTNYGPPAAAAVKGAAGDIVTMQPGAKWARLQSGSKSDLAADESRIFGSKFLEVFAIGGGFKWIYAFFEFLVEFTGIFKDVGVPMAGQINYVLSMVIQDDPPMGPILKCITGNMTRHAYKISGLTEHPALEDYWHPKPACYEGKGTIISPPIEDGIPFPFVEHGQRGTPEHHPFTDFDNALVGNERGDPCDLFFRNEARSFNITFKTGSRTQREGRNVFKVYTSQEEKKR